MLKNIFLFCIISLITYLIGCINSSIIVTSIFKSGDIRQVGSGNAGFTNVLRTMGKKLAIFTFIGDFLKGLGAIWFTIFLLSHNGMDSQDIVLGCYLASLFCILGHIYPCFFKFKGGKGILTAWATSLLIDWRIFVIIITIFLVTLIFSKIVSLSSIMAAISYPIAVFVTFKINNTPSNNMILPMIISIIMASVVIYKHKDNIKRLRKKAEKKIVINNS